MRKKILLAVLAVLPLAAAAQNVDMKRCAAELQGEVPVYSSDFKWNMSLDEIKSAADMMYKSEKRLAKRAYYDERMKSFVFPEAAERGGNVRIPVQFIKTVAKHVEKGFEREYIDAVIFPDMGHSHFLIPNAFYKKELEIIPVEKFNLLYEKIMANKDIKVVYHTAEQLKVLDESKKLMDDKKLQWRYYTRNLVGHNTADPDIELVNATTTSPANTMSGMDGYYWWGGGFNIHANKNGCFSFKKAGKTMYFDLSLHDLEPAPGSSDIFSDR